MKNPLDLFSHHADKYKTYRPIYPKTLYNQIFEYVHNYNVAWDCGTGNGQVAKELARRFQKVYASDISQKQLDHAHEATNIEYLRCRAESAPLPDASVDLITVAQAMHWFHHEPFYSEVERVAKPGAILAVWGYDLLKIHDKIDPVITDFYHNIVGPYWADQRKHVDTHYHHISLPFKQLPTHQNFTIETKWSVENLLGYLRTWSSVQKYKREHDEDPVTLYEDKFVSAWGKRKNINISFPIFLKIAQVNK